MFRRPFVLAICLCSYWAGCVASAQLLPAEDKVFDVPRCASGEQTLADWDGRGLQISTMCCAGGMPWPEATEAPSMRVAWNAAGLLVGVTVHHNQPWESDYTRHLFKGDSVEFFVAPRKGSRDRYMLVISPGLDPRYPVPRHCFFSDPSEEAEKDLSDLAFECKRAQTADGYTMNVLLPWSNLNIGPALGTELALQVYVMQARPNATPDVAMWNPIGESYVDPRSTMRIRLSERADAAIFGCATAQDDMEQNMRNVRIVAPGSYAGKQFELKTAGGGAVFGALVSRQTQSFASLSIRAATPCEAFIGSVAVPMTVIPPQDNLETTMTQKLHCRFAACVFQGDRFPQAYLEGAQHFRIANVTYYDAGYLPVVMALRPGRYGAVVEIADAKGKTTRRFRTLFRVSDRLGPWTSGSADLTALPGLLAADSRAAQVVPLDALGHRDLSFLMRKDSLADPDTAAMAAAFFDERNSAEEAGGLTDFQSIDRQWWVGLKRRLNGWDRQFPPSFVCPKVLIGSTATVLHIGNDREAGVKTEKVLDIDRICQKIVDEVGEPIAICLAHHGVVFFHHAYGQIAGRPFTVDDPCDIQSATKPLGGALMLEVLDSGQVRPDETIDRILPSFKAIAVRRKIIVSDLYDHLSGLTGDWGDRIHDTEEIIAGYYPVLDVGNYSYNEVGFALGGKIIEAVTGEAFPQFAQRHLLCPLGMSHTRVTNSGGHNATTALDYAKFGQLLLNRGAYGQMRFFSESTFDEMLPSTDSNRRGIGLMWMNWQKFGFSPATFGHNAGNSSILAVDPAHDLVVVIVSAGKRKDFALQAAPFYQAVINALD